MTRESDIATMLDEWRTVSERHRAMLIHRLANIRDPSVRSVMESTLDKILADRARLGDSDMQNDIYMSPGNGDRYGVLADEEREQHRERLIEHEAEFLLQYLSGSAHIALSECGAAREEAKDELRERLGDWAESWAERLLKARAEGAEPQHTGDDWVDGYPVRRP